jgi:hyperosmotically inducible periplasmic protein
VKLNVIRALVLATLTGIAFSSQGQDAASTPAAPTAKANSSSDRALARAVRRALSKAQGVDVSNLFVRARSGAVTLSGSVADSDQIAQAEQVTRTVPGVTSVSNRLTFFHGGNG